MQAQVTEQTRSSTEVMTVCECYRYQGVVEHKVHHLSSTQITYAPDTVICYLSSEVQPCINIHKHKEVIKEHTVTRMDVCAYQYVFTIMLSRCNVRGLCQHSGYTDYLENNTWFSSVLPCMYLFYLQNMVQPVHYSPVHTRQNR